LIKSTLLKKIEFFLCLKWSLRNWKEKQQQQQQKRTAINPETFLFPSEAML